MPANSPYPEPRQSSPYAHFLKIHFNIILPSTPGSPQWSLYLRFSYQTLYTSLPSLFTLHALPISFFSIISPKIYLVSSTEHEALHYVIFSLPCYLIPLQAQPSESPNYLTSTCFLIKFCNQFSFLLPVKRVP
jgi:hypothetical protein